MGTAAIYKFEHSGVTILDPSDGYKEGTARKIASALHDIPDGNLADRFFRTCTRAAFADQKEFGFYGEEYKYIIDEKNKTIRHTNNGVMSTPFPLHDFVNNQLGRGILSEQDVCGFIEKTPKDGYVIAVNDQRYLVEEPYSPESLTKVFLAALPHNNYGNLTTKVIRNNSAVSFLKTNERPVITYDSASDQLTVSGEIYKLGDFMSLHSDLLFTKAMNSTVTLQQALDFISDTIDSGIETLEKGHVGNASTYMDTAWRLLNEAELNVSLDQTEFLDQVEKFRQKVLSFTERFVIAYKWAEHNNGTLSEAVARWRERFYASTDDMLAAKAAKRGLSVQVSPGRIFVHSNDKIIFSGSRKSDAQVALSKYAALPEFKIESADDNHVEATLNPEERSQSVSISYSAHNNGYSIDDSKENQESLQVLLDAMNSGIVDRDILVNWLNDKLNSAIKSNPDLNESDDNRLSC